MFPSDDVINADGFGGDDGPITPANAGGAPVVMSSNDWWLRPLQTAADVVLARVEDNVAAAAGRLSSTVRNAPPGSQGVNVQASQTQGGRVQPFSWQTGFNGQTGTLVLVVVVLAIGIALLRGK